MRKLAVVALITLCCLPITAHAGSFVFVTLLEERQIVTFEQDPDSGELSPLRSIGTPAEPAALAISHDRETLFVSLRSSGELASYHIDADTGELTLLGVVPAGEDPAFMLPDASGRFLITAYYVSNCVTVHAVAEDGSLDPHILQTAPTAEKAHGLAFNADQTEVYVPHTGSNRIYHFHFNRDTGELTPADPAFVATPDEDHPRHISMHPSGRWVYVSNEAGDSIGVFAIDESTGTLERIQTATTLPDNFDGTQNSTAHCEMTADGRFVYVSNRGHDSIACFAVDQSTGQVTLLEQEPTEAVPRSFTIDPSGQFLYAAGEGSGRLAGFRIERDGRLERFGTWDSGPISWWALFIETE